MSSGAEPAMSGGIEISVVCAPDPWMGDLAAVHREFREQLLRTGRRAEFLYVLNGPRPLAEETLSGLRDDRFEIRILKLARGFDEAAGVQHAFDQARGRYILTIPDRFQIDPGVLQEIVSRLDGGDEVVVTRREPRRDPWFNRMQSRLFHALVSRIYGRRFRDLTCDLRGLTHEAARKLQLYGDLHRFIPVLAASKGFRVVEIPGEQRIEDRKLRVFGPGVYARRLLDVLHLYFLTRFTRKPLRFFGLIGMVLGIVGLLICAALAFGKIFYGAALADRPLLILGVLLIVLGVQITSIGLLGEIIIFLAPRRDATEVNEVSADEPS
jgi:glycosyltransferase involved in cell wall biosynthesis